MNETTGGINVAQCTLGRQFCRRKDHDAMANSNCTFAQPLQFPLHPTPKKATVVGDKEKHPREMSLIRDFIEKF
jgi:hypothetical protein